MAAGRVHGPASRNCPNCWLLACGQAGFDESGEMCGLEGGKPYLASLASPSTRTAQTILSSARLPAPCYTSI